MRRKQFVSLWVVLTAILLALLVLALVPAEAAGTAQAGDDDAAIRALVEAMEAAILAQDSVAYRALVDLSDPIFASEHTYWIEDWAEGEPLDRLSLRVNEIVVADSAAVAHLIVKWAALPNTSIRQAIYPVRFVRDAEGRWRYAGEAWITVATERFEVHAFPGMEDSAEVVAALMPGILDHAATSLDYQPQAVMHLKLYDSRDALGATIAFSLPPISGWNEPGESLKLMVQPDERTTLKAVLAHELTHFLTFDMADTSYGQVPWWLSEGIAEVVASAYWPEGRAEATLAAVRRWAVAGTLAPWEQIADFEATPVALWRYVYPQGYAFARFVGEVYGDSARNRWIAAMTSGDLALDAATQAALGDSFAALEGEFGGWLMAQP